MRPLRRALLSSASKWSAFHTVSKDYTRLRSCNLLWEAHRDRRERLGRVAQPHLRHVVTSASDATSNQGHPTIFALSTAPGRAAIAIIRISGSACLEIYALLCPNKPTPKPRYASFRVIRDPVGNDVLDSGALVLFFPGPETVTGEDVLELHVHGGPAIVKSVLGAIGVCANLLPYSVRYAEPGEFTRRAFLNDRLSLTEVEALGDSLSAATEEQRRLSVQGATGGLAKRYDKWRQMLLEARGELEALIDFSEDQHFDESPTELATSVATQIKYLVRTIEFHSLNAARGELLRNGIGISLIGCPNVGKSSILNQIVGRNAAIVSKEAGTTRDIVEVGIDLGGFFCRLGDTAGLRNPNAVISNDVKALASSIVGEIEEEGIRRAKARALESDVVVIVLSIEPSIQDQGIQLQLDQEIVDITQELLRNGKFVVIAVNKMDQYGPTLAPVMAGEIRSALHGLFPGVSEDSIFFISCRDTENAANNGLSTALDDPGNFQQFLTGLIRSFRQLTTALGPAEASAESETDPSMWQESLSVTARQRSLLDECVSHLQRFIHQADKPKRTSNPSRQQGADCSPPQVDEFEGNYTPSLAPNDDVDIVVAAESLRAAADCLARISGRSVEAGDVEEVLGVVFEKFCVGK